MKIVKSVRDDYDVKVRQFTILKKHVNDILQNKIKESKWHFESRIKTEDSYALKIESGRDDTFLLDDFYAATFVVENSTRLKDVEVKLKAEFLIRGKKPNNDSFTTKRPDSFPFDDLRLYLSLKKDERYPPLDEYLYNLVFEVQVKTYLQHAWAIATHDLIYKTDQIDWGKERIAYQIKAMLEHAELSINEVTTISKSYNVNKKNDEVEQLLQINEFIKKSWDPDKLPTDMIRLSRNIKYLLKELNLSLDYLKEIISKETSEGRGTKTTNLSPYLTVIQSIINQKPENIVEHLKKQRKKIKLLITPEIERKKIDFNKVNCHLFIHKS